MSTEPEPFGVYVHIPFCSSKCDYCAFATWTDRHHLTDTYLASVRVEIERAQIAAMPPATSVFVGGGTPSLVPAADLAVVINAVPVVDGAEITVECNPDDVDEALLAEYAAAGVNRVSLGVQSMNEQVLGRLGRRHRRANVARAVAAIRAVGIPTFNLDLIYGSAGESDEDWRSTVVDVLELEPPHISAYALTIEPGTPLAERPSDHPDDDVQADRYEIVEQIRVENFRIVLVGEPGNALDAGERVLPARWFHPDDANVGILFFEVSADAAYRAARTDAGVEAVDLTLCLLPDLRAGRTVMCLDVELVFILIGADVLAVERFAFNHGFDDTTCALCREYRASLILDLD